MEKEAYREGETNKNNYKYCFTEDGTGFFILAMEMNTHKKHQWRIREREREREGEREETNRPAKTNNNIDFMSKTVKKRTPVEKRITEVSPTTNSKISTVALSGGTIPSSIHGYLKKG